MRAGRAGRFELHFEALVAQELHARASMLPTAPVLPEQGSRTDEERVQ